MFLLPAACCLLLASPAAAQVDFAGTWQPRFHEDQPERLPGPELGDYVGLPINESARRWAESWDPSRITLPEEQCRVHTAPYIHRGPHNLRIYAQKNEKTQQTEALILYISTYEQTRTIWMDGRPHPGPNAKHTWMGFSTGQWQGDMLTVRTTHLKQNWHRRNGVPQSDRTTMTEHFIRNGDVMTHISVTTDPVFLTEPLVKSDNYVLTTRELPQANWLWVCQPVVEIADRPEGEVPAYLPGENPFLAETRKRLNLPEVATRGGAETMYPEFAQKLKGAR